MPTILFIAGWRIFFYSNEGTEPMHVHCEKGDMECKFWIHEDVFEIAEVFAFNLKPSDKKEIRKILYEHLEYIIKEWNNYFKSK